MINDRLREIFASSVAYAKNKRHEYLTVEHVFFELIQDEDIDLMLSDLGLDSRFIYKEIENYIDKNTPVLPQNFEDEPVETVTLAHAISQMVTHVQTSGRKDAGIEDMFVAILKEENTFATKLLRSLGVEKIDILEEISHKEEDEDETEEPKKTESILAEHSTELVSLAKAGKIDPVIGRAKEISRVVEILSRRKKNNPLLLGEPGVGKTAIAEGLALEIANANVHASLRGSKLFSIDMSSIVAGTKYRGDFEKKLKAILKEVAKIDNAILFIDEIHTVVGAGSVSGSSMDASNILKPMLANGSLKVIGATTFAEFRNDFGKDKAFSRRFAKVDINEPNNEDAVSILKGLAPKYEHFHGVKYSPKALETAVILSKKFINDKFLPDSAIDVIDEVGASVKLYGASKVVGVKQIEDMIAKIAHIPSQNTTKDDLMLLKNLEKNIKRRVFGQDIAVEKVVKSIKMNRAGLRIERKPIGSFLFTGPTGVGKTEVAKELARELGIHFERFDMSEYMEPHAISRLIGAPAGYVGFEKGGLLTEAIRKNPHCVLLLDEIEKAHPDLMSVLLQVMDNAEMTDNSGNKADFQNVILIMTSNLGTAEAPIMGFAKNDNLNQNRAINKFFAPEFRNRLDSIVDFVHLTPHIVELVASKFINDLKLILNDKKIELKITKKAISHLASSGYDKAMGARPMQRVISHKIKEPLSDEILFGKLKNGGKVNIDFDGERLKFVFSS